MRTTDLQERTDEPTVWRGVGRVQDAVYVAPARYAELRDKERRYHALANTWGCVFGLLLLSVLALMAMTAVAVGGGF